MYSTGARMITVRFDTKGLEENMDRLSRNLPTASTEAIREIGDVLSMEMKSRVNTWRGYLRSSIRPVIINKNTVEIKMAYYGGELELGHDIDDISPKLTKWATSKVGSKRAPFFLGSIIEKGRTDPHPFIAPSMMAIRPKVHPILKRHLDKGIRKSGFK